jgi:hypothetical protein
VDIVVHYEASTLLLCICTTWIGSIEKNPVCLFASIFMYRDVLPVH